MPAVDAKVVIPVLALHEAPVRMDAIAAPWVPEIGSC